MSRVWGPGEVRPRTLAEMRQESRSLRSWHERELRKDRRRRQGRAAVCTAGVLALIVAGVWGISEAVDYDGPTALTYCATDPPAPQDPRIVDDALCPNGIAGPGYQLVEQPVPDTDNSSFVLLAVGDTFSRSDPAYRQVPRGTQVRAGAEPARVVRSPGQTAGQRPAVTRSSPTISRGGLGVTSGGSSSGAAKGGSGSSGS